MYQFLLGEIYWLDVGYQDIPAESKIRPVIIIGIEDNELLLLVSTTSVPPNDPPKHFDQYKIPILNWRKAELLKPSWVQGLRIISLNKDQMQALLKDDSYIGRMTDIDFNYLISELENIHE